ncbi:MAG TPA: carbamoyltransferase HypF [Polyangiaceae bacterium]|nr:carbamoyltransferase HypF [Polyangiaceae bacterium]
MRLALVVRGTVQGVGFRPFVSRTARAHALSGFVRNDRDAVRIEVQGDEARLQAFTEALLRDLPRAAEIRSMNRTLVDDRAEDVFSITASDLNAAVSPVLPADLALCDACRREVRDPGDRRYRYPFTNCVGCGPRFSICEGLPYDRARTSMRSFPMCGDCEREYLDVLDRRYHAEPIACPACGPALMLKNTAGELVAIGEPGLHAATTALREGRIVALRGLGGFQLLCSATDDRAVSRLRARKRRPHKPFAVLFPNAGKVAEHAEPTDAELAALRSKEAPIVLVARRRDGGNLAESVAPESPFVGAMLPPTPLHELLFEDGLGPLICTSGNVSEEPICTTDEQAIERLGGVADVVLTHDRAVVRPLDDSLVRVARGKTRVLRRARGYAPRAVGEIRHGASVLAFGAHLKNTVTLGHRGALIPSQHLGDLDSPSTRALVSATVDDLLTFFDAEPRIVVCDRHPDYASTLLAEKFASERGLPLMRVQHHHAHVAATLAEHGFVDGDVLGLAWDGAGLGDDGTVWGGEALSFHAGVFTRVAHLETFPLPGAEAAFREPALSALGLLFAHAPERIEERLGARFGATLGPRLRALAANVNAPRCSSVGRLFDAVAGLLGASTATFEGQAAMGLEALARSVEPDGAYRLPLRGTAGALGPLVHALLEDLRRGTEAARIARRFHESLISFALDVAEHVGCEHVALGGGCFQNELLLQGLTSRLSAKGFSVATPAAIPANDGGISTGQAWLAARDPRA